MPAAPGRPEGANGGAGGANGAKRDMQPTIIEWQHINKSRFYVLGPMGALLARITLYPTQLIKTRLQVQKQSAYYKGTADALVKVVKFEGIRGLYKGFLPATIGIGAGQLYISLYEVLKVQSTPLIDNETARNLVSGSLASSVAQIIIVPINVISQRMMVHGLTVEPGVKPPPPLSMLKLIRTTFRLEGLPGFFKGYWASVIAFAPGSGIWWAAYGAIRRLQSKHNTVEQGASTLMLQSAAGAMAGVFTAVSTNPLDVVRARLQVDGRAGDGKGWLRVFGELWREERFRGLIKGVTARMWYMGANSMCMIAVYETVKRLSLRDDALDILHASDSC